MSIEPLKSAVLVPPYSDEDAPPTEPTGYRPHSQAPPHDLEAEESLLGCGLHTVDAMAAAERILTGRGDFYKPAHRAIFDAMAALVGRGEQPDVVTVAAELRATGHLEAAGGVGVLLALQVAPPATDAAPLYARVVADLARRRRRIERARAIAAIAADEAQDLSLADDLVRQMAEDTAGDHRGAGSSWSPVDLGPAVRGERTAPEPGILHRADGLGLFYPGLVHVVAGEPESGKSWLAQAAAAEVLQQGGRVCYIDFEDSEFGVVARLQALGATAAHLLAGFSYLRPDEAFGDQHGHHLDQAVTGATLAIVDGVTEGMALHGWAPKSDVDVALWQRTILRRIASLGPAVVCIDHVTKDRETRGRWSTGSQHKLAGIDGVHYGVEVRKPWAPGRSGLARIVVGKDRPGRVRTGLEDLRTVGDMIVTAWPDGGVGIEIRAAKPTEKAADGGHRPTVLMERCSSFLAAHHGKADPSTNSVRKGVKGDDSAIDRALIVLELEGYTTSTRQGQGTYWQHVKPYSIDSEEGQEDG